MSNETTNTDKPCNIDGVSNSVDFFEDAKIFLESQLPKDFTDKMLEYVQSKGYNKNEVRLFKSMIQQNIDFDVTITILKHYC